MTMLDIREIISIVMKAGIAAQVDYHAMSFGTLVADGPEYFATTVIGRALHQRYHGGNVGLEQSFSSLRDAGQGTRGFLKRGRKSAVVSHKGKVDVVLWQDDDDGEPRPHFLIEVKLGMSQVKLQRDIERLSQMVDELGTKHKGTVIGGALIILSQDSPVYTFSKRRENTGAMIAGLLSGQLGARVSIKAEETKTLSHELPLYIDEDVSEQVSAFNCDCVTVLPVISRTT